MGNVARIALLETDLNVLSRDTSTQMPGTGTQPALSKDQPIVEGPEPVMEPELARQGKIAVSGQWGNVMYPAPATLPVSSNVRGVHVTLVSQ